MPEGFRGLASGPPEASRLSACDSDWKPSRGVVCEFFFSPFFCTFFCDLDPSFMVHHPALGHAQAPERPTLTRDSAGPPAETRQCRLSVSVSVGRRGQVSGRSEWDGS